MRILFVVQGEGRGHMTQALALYRSLTVSGEHEVVRVLIGKSPQRRVPEYFVRGVGVPVEGFESLNFVPGLTNKRVNPVATLVQNVQRSPRYLASINRMVHCIEEEGVDLVVNFYEVLCGMMYLFRRTDVPMVCVGHQYLFLHPDFDFPSSQHSMRHALRLYTRLTSFGSIRRVALSFRDMPSGTDDGVVVAPPLLREELFDLEPTPGDYLLGYLLNRGFSSEVKSWSASHPEQRLEFFWDAPGGEVIGESLRLHPLDDRLFFEMMAGCGGYVTTAGFESVCEAAYLGKPVLMVPSHYEQECNAHDAVRSGIGVAASSFDISRLVEYLPHHRAVPGFRAWVESGAARVREEVLRPGKRSDVEYFELLAV